MPRPSVNVRTAAVLLALGGLGLTACDDGGDALALDVRESAAVMAYTTPETSDAERSSRYAAVASNLSSPDRDAPAAGAANLLAAQAIAGQGQFALSDARSGFSEVTYEVGRVTSLLERYVRVDALARAVAAQDLSDRLSEDTQRIAELQEQQSEVQAELNRARAELNGLRDRQQKLQSEAAELRNRISQNTFAIEGRTASERLPVVRESRALTLAANERERKAGLLGIEIREAERGVEGLEQQAEAIEGRIAFARDARRVTEQAAKRLNEKRRTLRRQADEAGNEATQRFGALFERYEAALTPFDDAIAKLTQARSRAGASDIRTNTSASIAHFLASAHQARLGVDRVLLRLARDLRDQRGRDAGVDEVIERLENSIAEAREAAATAYSGASGVLDTAAQRAEELRGNTPAEPASDDAQG